MSSWVDNHLFFCIQRKFLLKYNQWWKAWNVDIRLRGQHQYWGRIWFGGKIFEDSTLEEWDEDCAFPCKYLSGHSAQSKEDVAYTYSFDDINAISQVLGIPPKTIFLPTVQHTLVSTGTLRKAKSHWEQPRKTSTCELWKTGLLSNTLTQGGGGTLWKASPYMLGIFYSSPFLPCSSPTGLRADLYWWINKLWQPTICRAIPHPVSLYEAQASSDASSEFGIAITIGDKWRAWHLITG